MRETSAAEIERLAKQALLSRAQMANMCMAEAGHRQAWTRYYDFFGYEDLAWNGGDGGDGGVGGGVVWTGEEEQRAAWKAGVLVMAKTTPHGERAKRPVNCFQHFATATIHQCSGLSLDEVLVEGKRECKGLLWAMMDRAARDVTFNRERQPAPGGAEGGPA